MSNVLILTLSTFKVALLLTLWFPQKYKLGLTTQLRRNALGFKEIQDVQKACWFFRYKLSPDLFLKKHIHHYLNLILKILHA